MGTKRNVRWMVDFDYFEKLNPEESAYLLKFQNEYYDNSGLKNPDAIHGSDFNKKLFDATNARNRDLLSIKSCGGAVQHTYFEKLMYYPGSVEDSVIELIDCINQDADFA